MSHIIKDYSSLLHDNEIQLYLVKIHERVLCLETVRTSGEKVIVEFTGLMAHNFSHVIATNIILDLIHVTIEYFIKRESEKLSELLRYNFPSMKSREVYALKNELEKEGYKVFYLKASLGLNGYVIAKNVSVKGLND